MILGLRLKILKWNINELALRTSNIMDELLGLKFYIAGFQ